MPDRRAHCPFAIKVDALDGDAATFSFTAQRSMYRGKRIAVGDTIFLFVAHEQDGRALTVRGAVTAAASVQPQAGRKRQTPPVSIAVQRTANARQALKRSDLLPFSLWTEGSPEMELNFELYRQATNKIVA
jgi:hypothetical protein